MVDMDNKITVVGFKESGKTSYLTGMYTCMSSVIKNFSLKARNEKDLYLDMLWDRICQGNPPDSSDVVETYEFHLAHNFQPVCDFEWLDYPGGILAHRDKDPDGYKKLEDDIKTADCILLIVDGVLFTGIEATDENDYQRKLERKLQFDMGIRAELANFTNLSAQGIKLPPIGIVVTKCDLIDVTYQKAVKMAIRNRFSALFGDNRSGRVVVQMSVTLGGPIEPGFIPDPFCIEQPIAFAVISIFLKYLTAAKLSILENEAFINDSSGAFGSFFNGSKIRQAKENIKNLGEAIDKWSNDAFSLLELFSNEKTIYVGGVEKNFRQYYTEIFSDLTN